MTVDLLELALTFDGRTLDVADLVLTGTVTGTWPAFVRATRAGVALDAEHPPPDVRAAATAFRYERGLLSAADFVGWLERAGLRSADLAGVLRRRELRERHPAPDTPVEIAPVLRAEAICTGTFAALVRETTDRQAAQRALGGDAPAADAALVRELVAALPAGDAPSLAALPDLAARAARAVAADAALHVFAARVAGAEAVRRLLARHRLDWLRINGEQVAFTQEGAAREARLLVREGNALADVARLAGVAAEARAWLIDEAPPGVAGALVAALPGELVGPWAHDGEWRVLVVTGKVAPHAADAELCERARSKLLGEALGRSSAGRARTHVPV